ncbi:MAG: SDR family NAD(P)-dependent oxidoreductase [Patescibacteria group bacterium]
MDFLDKVVVITGGTGGLGRALALSFQKQKARVVVSSRNKEELEALRGTSDFFVVQADVSEEEDVSHLAEAVVEKFGRIDIWINNAGIWLPHAPVEEMDVERVRKVMDVNFFGTIHGSKAALMRMRKQGEGTIINILSTSALEGRANSSGYCASKYAADGFTKSLRKEVQGSEIKVFSIYPGGMRTNLFDESRPENYDEYMNPSDVAEKIVRNLKAENPEEEFVVRR